MLVNFFAFGVN